MACTKCDLNHKAKAFLLPLRSSQERMKAIVMYSKTFELPVLDLICTYIASILFPFPHTTCVRIMLSLSLLFYSNGLAKMVLQLVVLQKI